MRAHEPRWTKEGGRGDDGRLHDPLGCGELVRSSVRREHGVGGSSHCLFGGRGRRQGMLPECGLLNGLVEYTYREALQVQVRLVSWWSWISSDTSRGHCSTAGREVGFPRLGYSQAQWQREKRGKVCLQGQRYNDRLWNLRWGWGNRCHRDGLLDSRSCSFGWCEAQETSQLWYNVSDSQSLGDRGYMLGKMEKH